MTGRPMDAVWAAMMEEAALLDSAHRWTMASMALAFVFGVSALAGGFIDDRLFWVTGLAGIAGTIVHSRAGSLIDRARLLRDKRLGVR